MKSFLSLTLRAVAALVCVLPVAAQTTAFTTGQAAHLVIGQNSFTSGDYGASNLLLGSPSGIAYANGTLWVIDSNRLGATPNNNRILRFNDVSSYPSLTDLPDIPGSTCSVCRGTASLVLGQPDFNTFTPSLKSNGLRNPTGIATDGTVLAVADTDNNRVLIWLHLPTANGQPADVVVGQKDFTSNTAQSPSQTSLRAPSGVWINNGRLFVADTFDNRVLIYNKIPTSNNAPADVVLGQASFTAFVQPDLSQSATTATPSNMQTPVSVTTDGTRLFVADLAQNRVLMWNSIPSTNGAPADYAIGQPNLTNSATNASVIVNSTDMDADGNPKNVTKVLCDPFKTDAVTGTQVYPTRCASTLSFPRFAFSDGKRLFIADGGNDRVLIFNKFPTASGVPADIILGQPDQYSDNTGDNPDGTNAFETPSALAYDGTNLYVTDTYNRRVMVHTPGINNIPLDAVRNAASLAIYATGFYTFSGTITTNNTLSLTIGCTGSAPDCVDTKETYTHTMTASDTLTTVLQDLAKQVNTKDKNVTAALSLTAGQILLTAKVPGAAGGNVTYSVTSSSGATFLGSANSANLNIYLENPTQVAPGTLIQISGTNLCDGSAAADFSQTYLPTEMNNCVLYVDGLRAPLLYVSPTQINAQLPLNFSDRTSVSLYARSAHSDGSVTATTPIAVTVVPQNPGLFAYPGTDPRPGIVYHASSAAYDILDINGLLQTGDTGVISIGPGLAQYGAGTVNVTKGSNQITGVNTAWTSNMVGGVMSIGIGVYTIQSVGSATSITLTVPYAGSNTNNQGYTMSYGGRNYSYTETATDTLASTTAGLVNAINAGLDPYVYAVFNNEYNRIILYSLLEGPASPTISVFAMSGTTPDNITGPSLSITPYNDTLCCGAPANLPVTADNPAIPGEALYTFATGLGPTNPADIDTGFIYRGGNDNPPAVFVDSILVQGVVATPMNVALVPNTVGVYYVEFSLGQGLGTNLKSQMTIAQQLFVSNVVTFPVVIPGSSTVAPIVTDVTVSKGPLAGGNTVTISGNNFVNGAQVSFGGVAATTVTYVNSTTLTVVVPAGSALGLVSVIVTTPAGSNPANLLYTYVQAPSITSISPNSGPIAGNTAVTITGVGFTGTSSVTFGGLDAKSYSAVNDTTITAVVPGILQAATLPVVVTTPGGTATINYQYK